MKASQAQITAGQRGVAVAGREQRAATEELVDTDEHRGEGEVGDRSGDGDAQLCAGRGRFRLEPGEAAEQPQRDALDLDALVPGHERVAHLVCQQGGEEEQRRDDARGPVGRRGVAGRVDGEAVGREQPGVERRDHQHAPAEPDADSGDSPQGHVAFHVLPRLPVRAPEQPGRPTQVR